MISNAEIPAFLGHVERVHLVVVAVLSVAAALLMGLNETSWGVVIGGVVGTANFAALKWIGAKFVSASAKSTTFYASLFMGKLTVLMGVIVLCLIMLPITALGFLIGISALLPAIAIAYFWRTMAGQAPSSGHPVTEAKE